MGKHQHTHEDDAHAAEHAVFQKNIEEITGDIARDRELHLLHVESIAPHLMTFAKNDAADMIILMQEWKEKCKKDKSLGAQDLFRMICTEIMTDESSVFMIAYELGRRGYPLPHFGEDGHS